MPYLVTFSGEIPFVSVQISATMMTFCQALLEGLGQLTHHVLLGMSQPMPVLNVSDLNRLYVLYVDIVS